MSVINFTKELKNKGVANKDKTSLKAFKGLKNSNKKNSLKAKQKSHLASSKKQKSLKQGFILLVSGPSGAGKSTLLAKLRAEFKDECYFSVSCTTRSPRKNELEGVDYHFITKQSFKRDLKRGKFLEYARVHSNLYGTRLKETKEALSRGKVVIFDIDVQGFNQVKKSFKGFLTSVFITTKSAKELEKRLLTRNSNDDLKRRLKNAKEEMKSLHSYDFCIINEDLDEAYRALKSIFVAQKLKISRYNANNLLKSWIKGE